MARQARPQGALAEWGVGWNTPSPPFANGTEATLFHSGWPAPTGVCPGRALAHRRQTPARPPHPQPHTVCVVAVLLLLLRPPGAPGPGPGKERSFPFLFTVLVPQLFIQGSS